MIVLNLYCCICICAYIVSLCGEFSSRSIIIMSFVLGMHHNIGSQRINNNINTNNQELIWTRIKNQERRTKNEERRIENKAQYQERRTRMKNKNEEHDIIYMKREREKERESPRCGHRNLDDTTTAINSCFEYSYSFSIRWQKLGRNSRIESNQIKSNRIRIKSNRVSQNPHPLGISNCFTSRYICNITSFDRSVWEVNFEVGVPVVDMWLCDVSSPSAVRSGRQTSKADKQGRTAIWTGRQAGPAKIWIKLNRINTSSTATTTSSTSTSTTSSNTTDRLPSHPVCTEYFFAASSYGPGPQTTVPPFPSITVPSHQYLHTYLPWLLLYLRFYGTFPS